MRNVNWSVMKNPGLRARVRCNPGFTAFSSLLSQRIETGRGTDAYLMLVALGAPPALAWKIMTEWPSEWDLGKYGLTQRGSLRLATFIDDISLYDWPTLLNQAVRAAARAREEDTHV
jgi:hypothetical protein